MATLCMCAIHLYAATDSHITGHVLDAATQEHLGYINVQLQGTTIGCTTDESGHFFLKNLPLGSQIVVFSFVGYKTKEVPITIQADSTYVLDVSIEEGSYLLENVVVSANKYETKQKEVATIV
ncbi:MAG: carboxypeptidase-like regulatory domain-containing protein, partial [Prevotellaceae bacterium]|nr:carboxypeptidase-like regulatory domain-containing protein [Candidatus Colivivens equi]